MWRWKWGLSTCQRALAHRPSQREDHASRLTAEIAPESGHIQEHWMPLIYVKMFVYSRDLLHRSRCGQTCWYPHYRKLPLSELRKSQLVSEAQGQSGMLQHMIEA